MGTDKAMRICSLISRETKTDDNFFFLEQYYQLERLDASSLNQPIMYSKLSRHRLRELVFNSLSTFQIYIC